LADPAGYADYVIAVAGDPVWTALEKHTLPLIVQVNVPGQPQAKIYRTGRASVVSGVFPLSR